MREAIVMGDAYGDRVACCVLRAALREAYGASPEGAGKDSKGTLPGVDPAAVFVLAPLMLALGMLALLLLALFRLYKEPIKPLEHLPPHVPHVAW